MRVVGSFLVLASLLALGCHDGYSEDLKAEYSAAEFARLLATNSDVFVGRTVTIRGYLRPLSGRLILYQSQSLADKAIHHEGAVEVVDTSDEKRLRNEGLYYERTCTNEIVNLVGEVGVNRATGRHSIVLIQEIYLINADGMKGDLCYSSDDPMVYQPEELDSL